MNDQKLEEALSGLPLYIYAWVEPESLEFSDRVRWICQHECAMYGTTWACPPGVGTVAECKKKCLSYNKCLLISTISEVADISDLQATLATRGDHEAVTDQVGDILRSLGAEPYILSTEACAICKTCAWPDAPCRHPDKMYPCVESHGILVTALADRLGMSFFNGNLVTWYSLIFYNDPSASAENSVHG